MCGQTASLRWMCFLKSRRILSIRSFDVWARWSISDCFSRSRFASLFNASIKKRINDRWSKEKKYFLPSQNRRRMLGLDDALNHSTCSER